MSLSNLHLLDDSTGTNSLYKTERYRILSLLEGNVPTPYFDSKGLITIGIGFMIDGLISDNRSKVMESIGLTSTQQTAINDVWSVAGMTTIKSMPQAPGAQLNAKNAALRNYLNNALGVSQSFSMTETQIRAVFEGLMQPALNAVSPSINTPSIEQVILISLYHNGGGLFGDQLKAAIASDNRAEAWYEIRYGHKDELWDRRYAEATYFGLYGVGKTTPGEASSIYRMFMTHREKMLADDAAHVLSISRNVYGAAVPSMEVALTVAYQVLFEDISKRHGSEMAGLSASDFSPLNLLVDTGEAGTLPATSTLDATGYAGKARNLIVGDKGFNIILKGGAGDDVIIAGAGNDYLDGGADKDRLYGNAGNDTLDGLDGQGGDYLAGGLGNDIYYADNGDIIYDEDGIGTIYVGQSKTRLTGGERKADEAFFTSADKSQVYQENANGSIDVWTPEGHITIQPSSGNPGPRAQPSLLKKVNGVNDSADAAVVAQVVAQLRLCSVDLLICSAANDALFEIRRRK